MKYLIGLIVILLASLDIHGQSFSFQTGPSPNNLRGAFLCMKSDILQKGKWNYALSYSLVKYTDSEAWPNNVQPNFHIENLRDETILPFPELRRGRAIQINERDFRPRDLHHRFSFWLGYDFINNDDFIIKAYSGFHYGMFRYILWNVAASNTPVIFEEGQEIQLIPHHGYQIFQEWDIGLGVAIEIEYKLFENFSIGLNARFFNDFIVGGSDMLLGAGVSYYFNHSN
jgi:hypothetical protein